MLLLGDILTVRICRRQFTFKRPPSWCNDNTQHACQPTAVSEFETGGKKKKKKGSSSSKKKKSAEDAAPEDKKAIARAAAAKNKKANEKKAAAAEKKKKTALSLPDDDGEEIDLVAKMEEARRAMPNACVVRSKGRAGEVVFVL